MKIELSREIFEKYSNIKFHENPISGSRVVSWWQRDRRTDGRTNERTDGQTDSHDETNNAFRNFANEPKHYLLVKYLYKSLQRGKRGNEHMRIRNCCRSFLIYFQILLWISI